MHTAYIINEGLIEEIENSPSPGRDLREKLLRALTFSPSKPSNGWVSPVLGHVPWTFDPLSSVDDAMRIQPRNWGLETVVKGREDCYTVALGNFGRGEAYESVDGTHGRLAAAWTVAVLKAGLADARNSEKEG